MNGLISISCVMADKCCVWSCQYASAIYAVSVFPEPPTCSISALQTYRISIDLCIRPCIFEIFFTAGNINNAIDNHMTDVNALGCEFSGQRLCQSSLSEFGRGEGGETGGSFQSGRCAGEDEGGVVFWGCCGGGEEVGEDCLGEVEGSFAVTRRGWSATVL